jgi:hypothetical protein
MSLTYQLPSLIEFYLKADFLFTVAKLIISHSLPLLVRIVSVRDFYFYRNSCAVVRDSLYQTDRQKRMFSRLTHHP